MPKVTWRGDGCRATLVGGRVGPKAGMGKRFSVFEKENIRAPRRRSEQGSIAMFIVVFLSILATIPLGMSLVQISNRKTTQQINISVQANNVARAGLVEAVSWFRRQATQPVRSTGNAAYTWEDAAFYPRTSTNTALSDTLDESIGLVKEYSLSDSDNIWARFEVRRQQNTALNAVNAQAVHDVSMSRIEGATWGSGLAWYVEASGIVYRRRDASKAYNESPNEVISRSRVATEIRRISIVLPSLSALCVNGNRSTVTLANNSRLRGQTNSGLATRLNAGAPNLSGSSNILPATYPSNGVSITPTYVFGVSDSELKLMADYTVGAVSELPVDYPTMTVVYVNGNAAFNSVNKLNGGGILYVNGNLTITAAAGDCLFSGVIYVTGTTTITGEALISGAVVSVGNVSMNGNGGVAEIDYDGPILDSVRQQVAQYRENKAVFYSFSGTK